MKGLVPSWVSIGLAVIAAIIQHFVPLWVFAAFIVGSMVWTAIGLWLARRRWKRQLLLDAMEKAFGESQGVGWHGRLGKLP